MLIKVEFTLVRIMVLHDDITFLVSFLGGHRRDRLNA